MQAYEYLKQENLEGNAIEVYNARRKFFRGEQVLKGLEMEVPHGTIYVVAGTNGCGKTTLVRAILGQVKLSSGYVRVLDKAPGAKGHTVPGIDVGYMPQSLGMSSEFTLKEILFYFGALCKMYRWRVKERLEFFDKMFDFPKGRIKIKKLSFDMQRRLSFAVTLIHEPKLAILDEPTLGMDPVYAQKIWTHIRELTKRSKTFLITTKCVEEAAMADTVGFMHDGILLAQSSPQDIMKTHGASSLSEAYHQVFTKHKEGSLAKTVNMPDNDMSSAEFTKKMEETNLSEETGENGELVDDGSSSFVFHYDGDELEEESICQKFVGSCFPGMQDIVTCNFSCWVPNLCNVLNLFLKSLRETARNPRNLLSLFIFPLIQLYFISNAAGRLPAGLHVGIINDDRPQSANVCSQSEVNFGQLFSQGLTLNNTFVLTSYGSLEEGIAGVEKGDIWMAIYIPSNFSEYLVQNISTGFNAFSSTLDPPNDTLIELYADLTVPQISSVLQYQVNLAEEEFHTQMLDKCGVAPVTPVNLDFIDPAVYGGVTLSPMDYITPSLLLIIVFIQAASVVSSTLTKEMSEGFTERSIVANANLTEMVLALFILEFIILFIQIFELFLLMIYGLNVYFVFSSGIPLAAFLTFLTGYSGLTFGLMVASLTSDEKKAAQLISTVFFVLILFSGLIRPLEGANVLIQLFEYLLPTSFGVKAIRSIAERGWGLGQFTVWFGFLMTELWFLFMLVLAILGFKIRK